MARIGFIIIFIVFQLSPLSSQLTSTLKIENTSSVAGEYEIFPADIGLQVYYNMSSTLVRAVDQNDMQSNACDEIQNLEENIVLIETDSCSYLEQGLKVAEAGAIGVIICVNFENGVRLQDNSLSTNNVSIPVWSISESHCEALFMELANAAIPIELTTDCNNKFYGDHVLWGNEPGQGDFDGGINDWIVECEADTCWNWEANGMVTATFTNHTMKSSTACNGAMAFNSDDLDNNGSTQTIGEGLCPTICAGRLISPNILIDSLPTFNRNII